MRDKRSRPQQASLEEMLADPIVWTLMKSDRVEEQELRTLLKRVAAELAAGDVKMSVTKAAVELSPEYRRGVGIMLLNDRNEVFVGRRTDAKEAWQMPQGGIDEHEDPRDAAFRELQEEIGTDKAEVIAESKVWLRYDLPPEFRKRWSQPLARATTEMVRDAVPGNRCRHRRRNRTSRVFSLEVGPDRAVAGARRLVQAPALR